MQHTTVIIKNTSIKLYFMDRDQYMQPVSSVLRKV